MLKSIYHHWKSTCFPLDKDKCKFKGCDLQSFFQAEQKEHLYHIGIIEFIHYRYMLRKWKKKGWEIYGFHNIWEIKFIQSQVIHELKITYPQARSYAHQTSPLLSSLNLADFITREDEFLAAPHADISFCKLYIYISFF